MPGGKPPAHNTGTSVGRDDLGAPPSAPPVYFSSGALHLPQRSAVTGFFREHTGQ